MDLNSITEAVSIIASLPPLALALFGLLATCAVAGGCVYAYTSVCAVADAWREGRLRRVRRAALMTAHMRLGRSQH